MAQKTNIGWMNPKKVGQPMSQGGEIEGGTLNSLVGCYPVSSGCLNCYAVGTCYTKQCRTDALGKEFAGTVEILPNGLQQFTGKVNYIRKRLYAVLDDHRPRSWFVNSLSDLFYESEVGQLDEKIILEHFEVFAKAYWQEFRALTKRPERMLALDSKIAWAANVRMGVTVEDVAHLHRIILLGKTHAQHKWISFEPWITAWPDDTAKHIRTAFPLTIEGRRYDRLRDLLKACDIECSIVGGESDETKKKPRYCGFDDIHYILDETTAAGAHPCLKQLGTRWAIAANHYGAGGTGAHHGSQKELWPKRFQKYSTGWPNLKLPACAEPKKKARPAKSWIDFDPNFLKPERAQEIFDWINTQDLKPETGNKRRDWAGKDYCNSTPTHDTIHWGPRQAYLACISPDVRVKSSGPIPEELSELHIAIEQRYRAHFNSIQVNRHYDHNSFVLPHSDNMHGDIVMLSLGAPRRFVLKHKFDDKAKSPRWKAGDIYFDKVLPHGSLLTIYRAHQFDVTHEMPKAEQPCGPRISLIWRYIAKPVTKVLGRGGLMDGMPEYQKAQKGWSEAQSEKPRARLLVAAGAKS